MRALSALRSLLLALAVLIGVGAAGYVGQHGALLAQRHAGQAPKFGFGPVVPTFQLQVGPGTPAWNPAWYALTDIYWDPVAGNDGNTGHSGSPVLTWAEIVRRYGSASPIFNYGQSVTFHQLASQPSGADPVFLDGAKLTNGGKATLDATAAWVTAGADFVCGALSGGFGYAGAIPTAGGAPMTMEIPVGAQGYVAQKVLLKNTTRSSYAFVDSISGTNAILQQPQTSASLLAAGGATVDNDWVAGDNIRPYTLPNTNLKEWHVVGADVSSGLQSCSGMVLGTSIADVSGASPPPASKSRYVVRADETAQSVLSLSIVLPSLQVTGGSSGFNVAVWVNGCFVSGLVEVNSGYVDFRGGGLLEGIFNRGDLVLENNVVHHFGMQSYTGQVDVGGVYSDGTWQLWGGDIQATSYAWGSYTVSLKPGSTFWNNTGSTYAAQALLTTGAIDIRGAATATATLPSGKTLYGVPITPANIDTYQGLTDMQFGARFAGVAQNWNPNTPSGCTLWLDASSGLTASTTWVSRPTNAQATPLSFTYHVNSSSTATLGAGVNASPTVDLTTLGYFTSTSHLSTIVSASAWTALAVYKYTGSAVDAATYNNPGLIADAADEWWMGSSLTKFHAGQWDGAARDDSTVTTAGVPHYALVKYDGSKVFTSMDGAAFDAGVAAGNVQSLAAALLVGGDFNHGATYVGSLAHLVVWNVLLGSSDLTAANAWAATIVGPTSSNLPLFLFDVTLTGGTATVASGKNLTNAVVLGVRLKTATTATGDPICSFVAGANGNVTCTSYTAGAIQAATDASTYTVTFANVQSIAGGHRTPRDGWPMALGLVALAGWAARRRKTL